MIDLVKADDVRLMINGVEVQPMNYFDYVKSFHEKFERNYTGKPRLLRPEQLEFRTKFLMEEMVEFRDAHGRDDLVGCLDALVDLIYVALGTAEWMGLPFDDAFKIVHMKNMEKVAAKTADDSKRGYALDIVKPENWVGPEEELSQLLKEKSEGA